jgi:hypothetical protein
MSVELVMLQICDDCRQCKISDSNAFAGVRERRKEDGQRKLSS